jgi:hypothetical protein
MESLREVAARMGWPIQMFFAAFGKKPALRSLWTFRLLKAKSKVENSAFLPLPEEDQASILAPLLASSTADELTFSIRHLDWPRLTVLMTPDNLDQILRRLSELLDLRDNRAAAALEVFFDKVAQIEKQGQEDLNEAFRKKLSSMSTSWANSIFDDWILHRNDIVEMVGSLALRGKESHAQTFRRMVLLAGQLSQHRTAELQRLAWEASYSDFVCAQLARLEFSVFMVQLGDLVDATLPAVRRLALFDVLRRWKAAISCLEKAIQIAGSPSQRAAVGRFADSLTIFLDNFDVNVPPATLLTTISQLLGVAAAEIQDLRRTLQEVGNVISETLTLPHILGTDDDDQAREVARQLFGMGTIALLPASFKGILLDQMLSGHTGGEDEEAILDILRESKKRSLAEFLQLVVEASYDSLDYSIDNNESDQFRGLFAF